MCSLSHCSMHRCLHSEKKYGSPSVCEHCSTRCAFPKPEDIKRKVSIRAFSSGLKWCKVSTGAKCLLWRRDPAKYFLQVDGKTLCLLCTIKYKKDMFKKRNGTSAVSSGTKRSRHHTSGHRGKQTETDAGYVGVGHEVVWWV